MTPPAKGGHGWHPLVFDHLSKGCQKGELRLPPNCPGSGTPDAAQHSCPVVPTPCDRPVQEEPAATIRARKNGGDHRPSALLRPHAAPARPFGAFRSVSQARAAPPKLHGGGAKPYHGRQKWGCGGECSRTRFTSPQRLRSSRALATRLENKKSLENLEKCPKF